MRNITASVDDDVYRRSRIRAAELNTSVSALVRGFLGNLVGATTNATRAEAEEERRHRLHDVIAEFEAHGVGLRLTENLPREELYDRARARAEALVNTMHCVGVMGHRTAPENGSDDHSG